ncbi:MAG: Transcription factor iws1 [Icmadophila ericetorum]|nr:Transcription factor iws1 [Icmadophila ericetorum]
MSLSSDSRVGTPEPEAGHDPNDPNQPLYDDRDPPSAPIVDPIADMDDLSDNDSVLSDVDEAQFEDFDPANVAVDDRPAIAVDEDNVKLLGRHKRKRDADGDYDAEGSKKKKKEGKREKPKKARKKRDDDDMFSGGEELDGKRIRKKKAVTEGEGKKEKPRPRKATPENEEELDPQERKLSFHQNGGEAI